MGSRADWIAHAENMLNVDPVLIAPAQALQGIGYALLALSKDDAVASMREHAAEHGCPLVLHLIDLDVFGVRCERHPDFHLEWRTT